MNSNLANNGLDPEKLPSHIAVIMDGNGRWARKRLLNRIKGHEKGAETVRMVVRTCREIGISYLTLYAFSTENWDRPEKEVNALMGLLKKFLADEKREMMENGIRLQAIGQLERLPQDVRAELDSVLCATAENSGMCLNLGLSYGGRTEIVEAVKRLLLQARDQSLDASAITPEFFSRFLYTADMPDPELLIRTSGELRVSNFLLWQIAYSEIHVTSTLWPDLSREELVSIVRDYQNRERRFGRV
ncbi:MAG: isoprenyl transferase [Desulfosalsimonadaceae bacterium]